MVIQAIEPRIRVERRKTVMSGQISLVLCCLRAANRVQVIGQRLEFLKESTAVS